MPVLDDTGAVFLLGHGFGEGATAWVERIDPRTLQALDRSDDLAGGPSWPGGMAVHRDGSLHVVFGRHAHRLAPDLTVLAMRELPRDCAYNSFVTLPDGHLVTKDFAGPRMGVAAPAGERRPAELVVLEPEGLAIVATLELPEPSIARLSAAGDDVVVVGDTSLLRVHWDGVALTGPDLVAPYRTMTGQGYGWDAVLTDTAAWFLDDGEGTEGFRGSFAGVGVATAPLHLVRVDLATGVVALHGICGKPGGIVANPPLIDVARGIAVGFDSSNGVVTAFDLVADDVAGVRWTREQHHASHLLLFGSSGELVTCDYDLERGLDQVVVLAIDTGAELGRVDTGSALQSPVFPAAGLDRDVYYCSFTTVARIATSG